MEKRIEYGARIERGTIAEVVGDQYVVRSMTRLNVVTEPIAAMIDGEYSAGDEVYFFLFDDGDGMILHKR